MLRRSAILRNAWKSVKKRALRWIAGVSPAMSDAARNGLDTQPNRCAIRSELSYINLQGGKGGLPPLLECPYFVSDPCYLRKSVASSCSRSALSAGETPASQLLAILQSRVFRL